MPRSNEPVLPSLDDYRDAFAIVRATLHNDSPGLYELMRTCNIGLTFQAMTRMYLGTILFHAEAFGQSPDESLDIANQRLEELFEQSEDEQ